MHTSPERRWSWLNRNRGDLRVGRRRAHCCCDAACKPGAARALWTKFAFYCLRVCLVRVAVVQQRNARQVLLDATCCARAPDYFPGATCSLARNVQPRDLPHVLLAPAAPQQPGDQIGKLGHVLEPDGHLGAASEVGAEPDVVDAGDLADVLDVVCHLGERRFRGARRR